MRHLSLISVSVLLSACAGLSTKAPQALDLSGTWQLNRALSDIPAAPTRRNAVKGPPAVERQRKGGMPGGASSMHEMMLSLKAHGLEIEQTSDSMGIQFRSRQDQGYRDISWGKKTQGELKTESGWENNSLVVKMQNGRMKLEERYTISADRQLLTLFVELSGGPQGARKLRKVFDRQD